MIYSDAPISASPISSQQIFSQVCASIAFDTFVDGGSGAGNSLSWSHTTSGTNQIIFAEIFCAQTDATQYSATVDGNAMTRLDPSNYFTQQATTDANKLAVFYYVGTTAGAHTVAIATTSSGGLIEGSSVSYSNVSQSSPIDASITSTTDAVSSKTQALTSATNNCWDVICARWQGSAINAGTGSTKRGQESTGGPAWFDSNAALSTGSNSMTITRAASSGGVGIIMFAIKPFCGSSPVVAVILRFLSLLGVGQ